MTDFDELRERLRRIFDQSPDPLPEVKEIVRQANPLDLAEILKDLEPVHKLLLIDVLSEEQAALVLDETDHRSRRAILEAADEKSIADLVEEMPPDEGADLLGQLPEEKEQAVLEELPREEALEIRELLEYLPTTAGGIMTTELVNLTESMTAAQALEMLREASEAEEIASLYVLDEAGRLKGYVPIRRLVTSSPDKLVGEMLESDVIEVRTDVDQEEVARLVDKYNLSAVPVVDEHGVLKGAVTVDDVIDVIREEVSEDMLRLAGTASHHPTLEPVRRRVLMRLPWLATTLLGGLVTMLLLSHFRPTVQKLIPLIFFMPIIQAMGGNVGLQSSTIMVRGLATGEVDFSRLLRVLSGEVRVGGIIALVCALFTAVVASFFRDPALPLSMFLPLAVGLAMFCGITMSALVGTLIPMLCHKVGVDPAVTAGPFITTLNDVISLLIYLSIATLVLTALGS
jgi:magnesium transporter